MSGSEARLVEHVLALDVLRMPPDVVAAALAFLQDTLAVGIAGCRALDADRIAAAATTWGGPASGDGCPVLGRPGLCLSAPYAAFVNAYQIHCQEFDCVHEAAVAHPMATVVAALLAGAAAHGPVTGADLLAALVGGVDVVATLGVAARSPLRFFRPATAGIFGSVAALCRLRRLDAGVARDALGYALSFASGTMQAHVEGKPALAVQVAAAARSAVEAVDLAVAGMAGPGASIDGPFGYLALFEERHDIAAALAGLGERWHVRELSWKPFPTGRAAHGAIVATQALMHAHGLVAGDVASLRYRAPPLIARLVGRRAFPEMTVSHARLCFPYLGAVVLAHGTVGLDDFDAGRLADPALHALAERIVVEADDNPDPAAFVPATATVVTFDGRTVRHDVDRQYGSPAWPLSPDAQHAKARECCRFGGLAGGEAALIDAVGRLPTSDDATATLAVAFGRRPDR